MNGSRVLEIDTRIAAEERVADLVEIAAASIVAVVNAVLGGKEPGRFAEATRLCQVGVQLLRSQARGVEGFVANGGDHHAEFAGGNHGVVLYPGEQMQRPGGENGDS